jgi:carotenoid cleavage dioxygenase
MVHGFVIPGGHTKEAVYFNNYIQTPKLKDESVAKRALYPRIGEMSGLMGLTKLVFLAVRSKLGYLQASNMTKQGTANTSLLFFNGKLLALQEASLPFEIQLQPGGEGIKSHAYYDFEKQWKRPFTAHPKICPKTGECLFFGYDIQSKPHCVFSVMSSQGKMRNIDIGINAPVMMHDFAITDKYCIFLDMSIVFDPIEMVKGSSPFFFDKAKNCRYGVMPRDATSGSQVQWFEGPPSSVLHTVNAWEEGDEVVMFGIRMNDLDFEAAGRGDAEATPPSELVRMHARTYIVYTHACMHIFIYYKCVCCLCNTRVGGERIRVGTEF